MSKVNLAFLVVISTVYIAIPWKSHGQDQLACKRLFASTSRRWPFDNALRDQNIEDAQKAWAGLKDPFTGSRPHGLKALHQAIAEDGVFVVVPEKKPSDLAELDFLHKLFGVPLYFAGDVPAGAKYRVHPGVALQPGNTPALANAHRGTINPHMGYGTLHGNFENKMTEYEFARSVDPSSMPFAKRGSDIIPSEKRAAFEELREDAKGVIARLMTNLDSNIRTDERRKILKLFDAFIEYVDQEFPDGAFIKRVDDSMGLEGGGMITSFDTKTQSWVRQFMEDLNWVRYESDYPARTPPSDRIDRKIGKYADTRNSTQVFRALLYDLDKVMVQARLNPAKTPLGNIMEFRVNFIDGEAAMGSLRESWEYMPAETQAAMDYVNAFFKKAPLRYRYLSGGADVMLDTSGKFHFIEFNFGAQAGDMDPWWGAVYGNQYISSVQGKPTPMIEELQRVYDSGLDEQKQFLEGLEVRGSILFYSTEEVLQFFRDRYLDDFARDPSIEREKLTLKSLWDLTRIAQNADESNTEDVREIYSGAESFIKEFQRNR